MNNSNSHNSNRLYGCHVSCSGGHVNALIAAEKLAINTIQIHPCPPQKWNTAPFKAGLEDAFLERLPNSGVRKIFFHGIYLINLANPDDRAQKLAQLSLSNDLDFADRLTANGVIFHVGSLKHIESEEKAFELASGTINRIFEATKSSSNHNQANNNQSKLIMEVAAGAGTVIGQNIEQLISIYERVENKERLGFALDTQHLWASGNNLNEDLEQLLNVLGSSVGLDKLYAVHLNDSKTKFASKTDRHENLGDGTIGFEILKNVFFNKRLTDVPFILETPAMKELDLALEEVKKLHTIKN